MEAEAYPQEVLAEDEPRYLRRQKPLEIKRRKFGRRAWMTYLRAAGWIVFGLSCAWTTYACARFLYSSPEMALIHPDQVAVRGRDGAQLRYVSPAKILEVFTADRGHSVLRIPLDARRRQLETLPWVEQATVRRALPNRLHVEIVERTPVAFLRQGSELSLVDGHGVILERPLKASFHFPVVTGVSGHMASEDRQRRMQLYTNFTRQIESARRGAADRLSEVDLAEVNDLRAAISGLPGAGAAAADVAPLLVHFGDTDFEGKYRALVENIAQWRATVGRVESVDLRFSREAIVNQDTTVVAQQLARKQALPVAQKPGGKAAQHAR